MKSRLTNLPAKLVDAKLVEAGFLAFEVSFREVNSVINGLNSEKCKCKQEKAASMLMNVEATISKSVAIFVKLLEEWSL